MPKLLQRSTLSRGVKPTRELFPTTIWIRFPFIVQRMPVELLVDDESTHMD